MAKARIYDVTFKPTKRDVTYRHQMDAMKATNKA